MPAASPARGEAPVPWGRFVRIFKQHVGERDHLVFSRPEHVIGRQAGVCDIVLKPVYISRRHCTVRLQGVDEAGEPVVMLSNESKYGVFVDRVAVNHLADVQLVTGSIVHFTEPDLPGQRHHAYRFELLPEGLTPALVAQREQLQLSETASTPAPPTTRKRKRGAVVSQSSQGSQGSVDSDELPVSARTRSRPEKKQRRGSVDPSSQIASQSENTNTSNLSVNTSARSSGTAPGKKRRRSDSWVLEEEGNSAADTVAATAQKQRKIDHENKIRLANVERELQRVRQQLDASERGRAQLQLGLSETQQQLADSQRQFADFQRQHTDSERQHRETVSMLEADRDAQVLELKAENTALKVSSEKERAVLERKAKSMEMEIKTLNAKMERERMETRDKLVEADLIKARANRRHNEAYAFFHQGMLRLNRDPTQSSQEGSEESPSLLAARRQSLESTTQNEQSPPTPSLTATAPVVDGIARVVRADEAKSGSSQELSSQSQSQSQSQPQSQSQETVFLVAPYRGRAARRVLTSPDEEIKRQQ